MCLKGICTRYWFLYRFFFLEIEFCKKIPLIPEIKQLMLHQTDIENLSCFYNQKQKKTNLIFIVKDENYEVAFTNSVNCNCKINYMNLLNEWTCFYSILHKLNLNEL